MVLFIIPLSLKIFFDKILVFEFNLLNWGLKCIYLDTFRYYCLSFLHSGQSLNIFAANLFTFHFITGHVLSKPPVNPHFAGERGVRYFLATTVHMR